MQIYGEAAPDLALRAIRRLGPLGRVTHLVVASCTGFVAPGIGQIAVERALFIEFVPLRAGSQRRAARRQEEACVNQMIHNLRVLLPVHQ